MASRLASLASKIFLMKISFDHGGGQMAATHTAGSAILKKGQAKRLKIQKPQKRRGLQRRLTTHPTTIKTKIAKEQTPSKIIMITKKLKKPTFASGKKPTQIW
jgi:hypothetical protein